MAYEIDKLLADLHRLQLEEEVAATISWWAMRRRYQGQLSDEQEAQSIVHDAEVDKDLDDNAELRALVEAGDDSAGDESLAAAREEEISKLEKAADRKEEATAHLYIALATVRLLAPPKTTAGFERAFAGGGDRHPTSKEFLAAMDGLVDTMRDDLGLGPRWWRQWWRSPNRWWRPATPEST